MEKKKGQNRKKTKNRVEGYDDEWRNDQEGAEDEKES